VDPTRLGAHIAFELATIRGAEAVGMAADIGSLEVGKKADLVIHDTLRPEWTPRGDVALQLVWSADGRSVRDVLIDGKVVVRNQCCTTVDETALRLLAAGASKRLLDRAGKQVPHKWPMIYVAGPTDRSSPDTT
jgi:5-methylthioadenosine/S-adenosylhomocysteine deaminase